MTCRCVMCGVKNAGKIGRGSYAKAGIVTDERKKKSNEKDYFRKVRRVREATNWKKELN